MRRKDRFSLFILTCASCAMLAPGCPGSEGRPGKRPVAATSAPATSAPASRSAVDWQGPVDVRGVERTYLLHLPPSYDSRKPAPLVLVFHGGRGSGKRVARMTGFSRLADEKGFIVVYPDGLDGHWNDGRPRPGESPPDDVAFISTLIDRLGTLLAIDRKRVYATGISNGAIFAQRLGCELPDKIAAIAPVAGTLARDLAGKCRPSQSVSVLMIHGTADAFVPYGGGEVRGDIGGRVLSVKETAAMWAQANGCVDAAPQEQMLAPKSASGLPVRRETWGPCKAGTDVVVYTVEGGGHTWPGAPAPRAMARVVGPTSQDFDATRVIWEFFELHPKWQE
jgi:polyhydroxybutyrate depolymerase